jgi:hypothetical protein
MDEKEKESVIRFTLIARYGGRKVRATRSFLDLRARISIADDTVEIHRRTTSEDVKHPSPRVFRTPRDVNTEFYRGDAPAARQSEEGCLFLFRAGVHGKGAVCRERAEEALDK